MFFKQNLGCNIKILIFEPLLAICQYQVFYVILVTSKRLKILYLPPHDIKIFENTYLSSQYVPNFKFEILHIKNFSVKNDKVSMFVSVILIAFLLIFLHGMLLC